MKVVLPFVALALTRKLLDESLATQNPQSAIRNPQSAIGKSAIGKSAIDKASEG